MRASRSYSSPFSFLPRRKKMMPALGLRGLGSGVVCVVEVVSGFRVSREMMCV